MKSLYLHIGGDVMVSRREIIAILDLDNVTVTQRAREFIKSAQNAGNIVAVADELPKSCIVAQGRKGAAVYISPLSTATLSKRLS